VNPSHRGERAAQPWWPRLRYRQRMSEPLPSYAPRERPVLTPTQLNQLARQLLEDAFSQVWVEGEISNYTRAASGHWYFTLKDRSAQIRCAMFKSNNLYVRNKPADGAQVLVRGRISLYEARGDYQLICEHMEDAGLGRLMREFERLKALLQAEGLTDPARKRVLPRMPMRIAVISSAQGAAIRDVLAVCARRWPLLQIDLFPAQVQGAEAPGQLRAALSAALSAPLPYALVLLTRGGGSLEDLAAFNDEALARMIAAAPIPTISAVGHETDFTIADLVADVRAATPSAAAELMTPSAEAIGQLLLQRRGSLRDLLRRHLQALQQANDGCERLLRAHDPRRALELAMARLRRLHDELGAAERSHWQHCRQRLALLGERLRGHAPERRIARTQQNAALLLARLKTLSVRWLQRPRTLLDDRRHRLDRRLPEVGHLRARSEQALASLHQLGPEATLQRGYVLLRRASDQQMILRASMLAPGEPVIARFADGERSLRSEES
jgi:exodeoxyribonuclease VII large subunit